MTNAYDTALEVLRSGELTRELLEDAIRAGLDAHGLTKTEALTSTRMTSTLGYAYYRGDGKVKLSWTVGQHRTLEGLANTIAHEVAHIMTKSGHDQKWKDACLVTGAAPERCASAKMMPDEVRTNRRYALVCRECEEVPHYMAGKPRVPRIHRACGKRLGVVDTKLTDEGEDLVKASHDLTKTVSMTGTINHARDCFHPLTKKERARCRRLNS